MPGTASGGVCYGTAAEAVAMWCSAVNVSTPAGLMTCQSTSNVTPAGDGSATFKWQRKLVASDGTSSTVTVSGQGVQGCEPYDWAYWAPAVAAFMAASVAILCARWLYRFWHVDQTVV